MAKAPETYARGGTWWLRFTDAHGIARRVSLRVPVGSPADILNAAVARAVSGAEAPRTGPTIGHVYERALREHWARHKDRRGVESKWALLLDVKGEDGKPYLSIAMPIASVTASVVSGLRGALLARGDSPKTVNRKLAVVSKLVHLAVEWEMLDRLPVIKRFREKRGRIRWLSPQEEATACAFLERHTRPWAHDMAELVVVLVDTGMRLGESLRLKDEDVKHGASRYTLIVWDQKGGGEVTSRAVPLTRRAELILRSRANREADVPRGQSRPFAGITQDIAGHLWADTRAAMGQEHDEEFVIHALRHTFGVRMVEAGVDIRTLQVLMGHAKSSTTEIYAHVTGRGAASAIDALERVRDAVPEAAPMLRRVGGSSL